MKSCLAICTLLVSCVPEKAGSQADSFPGKQDRIQHAADQLDAALMHDYMLMFEKRLKSSYSSATPMLPEMADDASFLRRACIDLAGRLPRVEEVRAFMADRSTDKHARLTDALTREPGAAEVRFRMLAEAFRVKDHEYKTIAWLRQAAVEDRPYAEIVAHMIGGWHVAESGGSNPRRTCAEAAYTVLGVDLYCAMCHDHPFTGTTQHEFYAFAACFTGQKEMRLPLRYLYPDGKPGDVVPPGTLRLGWWRDLRSDQDKLVQVVKWMTEEEPSERYAMVASLRVWSGLFGMPGQEVDVTVGGVDDAPPWHGFHGENMPYHYHRSCFDGSPRGAASWLGMQLNSSSDFTQATKLLTEEFLRCSGRLAEFQRILARTEAYKRSGIDFNWNWRECYLAPAPQIRRLPSEVIWKTLTAEDDRGVPQVPAPGHPLRMLGRGIREYTDESRTPLSHELVRFMMNDRLIDQATAKAGEAEKMFLELLGRKPTEREQAAIQRSEATNRDIAWALLNTKEFMFR
ncbi:DUF1549 domain-containing protein [Prosthecobacter vanneervenii]|uniref:DUF1549 domain-containing protein n=1 Tax=Prosthecobacter vanneervenii TaxID=48466 RepID=A0A7W7Y9Q4_9BACT|nr:DUF1549 domain-containing protein [Prosthecobacter vanneervenii]MBB5032191.1 hypothetical protein [Prosthecobacter vanneervenii]